MKNQKKNKKSFTDGLEMLFNQTLNDNLKDKPSVLEVKRSKSRKQSKSKTKGATASNRGRKRSRKSFSTNLEVFFRENPESNTENTGLTEPKGNTSEENKGRQTIGVDVLIHRTTQASKEEPVKTNTRRVTFVLDKSKIEELKILARSQNKYMKTIISDLIEQYLKNNKCSGAPLKI